MRSERRQRAFRNSRLPCSNIGRSFQFSRILVTYVHEDIGRGLIGGIGKTVLRSSDEAFLSGREH